MAITIVKGSHITITRHGRMSEYALSKISDASLARVMKWVIDNSGKITAETPAGNSAMSYALDNGYTVDINGIIRNPGKFELEHVSTLYLWDTVIMDRAQDDTLYFGEYEYYGIVWIDKRTAHKLDLPQTTKTVVIWTNSQGFVYTELFEEKMDASELAQTWGIDETD